MSRLCVCHVWARIFDWGGLVLKLKYVMAATAVVLAAVFYASGNASAAAASPALALGQQIAAVQKSGIVKADVGFGIYIGPRYRRYRHYRRYRRYRRPGFHLYIGPRYRPYRRYRRYRRGRSCRYWHRRCVRNWGYGNSNYYGCMRYHGCR